MLNLLSIEYYKLKNTRFFWIIIGLFGLFLISVPIVSKAFFDFLDKQGAAFKYFNADTLPIFDFVDIWQNLTFTYSLFSFFLAFIVVISVCNEFSYGTIKQNIMDGMSRKEFLWSKFSYILAISFITSIVVLIIGLIMGFAWSPVTDIDFIVKNINFIGAYFLHLVAFQTFCMFIAFWIKRSGFAMVLILFYVFVIENILYGLLRWELNMEWLTNFLPLKAIGGVIKMPFGRYFLQETQSYVAFGDVAACFAYLCLFLYLSYVLVVKRDLT